MELLSNWSSILNHRGPDAWGWYKNKSDQLLLFNSRLAITGVENGCQPIPNEKKTIWLTFSGEIYNHKSLRSQLIKLKHVFRTDSDAEVILHLYEEFGIKCFTDLDGEFAFSLYDGSNEKLYLVRDRFGVKPLYYFHSNSSFIFSSEIKGIFCVPGVERSFDEKQVINQVQSFLFSSETLFKNVKSLSPGNFLSYDLKNGKIETSTYWKPNFKNLYPKIGEKEAFEQFAFLFTKAIEKRIPCEVPYGVYLSGGIDSSAIASVLSNDLDQRVPVFSIGFENKSYDESNLAASLAEDLKMEFNVLKLQKGDLGDHFVKSLWHSEIPVTNPHGTAKMMLAQTAKKKVKVVLTGEGADEMLWGYSLFNHLERIEDQQGNAWQNENHGGLSGGSVGKKLLKYKETTSFFGSYPYSMQRFFFLKRLRPLIYSGGMIKKMKNWSWKKEIEGHLDLHDFEELNSKQATQLMLMQTDFPSYLLNNLGDRQEMASGLEGRLPFLDYDLTDFTNSLPDKFKVNGGRGKYILRNSIHDNIRYIHGERLKKAFYTPAIESLDLWHNNYLNRYFAKEKFEECGIFKYSSYKLLRNVMRFGPAKYTKGLIIESILMYVLSFHIIHEIFIKNFDDWKNRYASSNSKSLIEQHNMAEKYQIK